MTEAPPILARAARLPQETITLCFTDVEGSTPLQQRIPAQYAEVLVAQRAIVKNAVESHHGLVISAEGEELYSAFPTALDGVRAAIEAQFAFLRHPWPAGVEVRVRIGMHTGAPIWTSEEYVGIDVVRANRVMSAGYGGQVLISGTTFDALADQREAFEFSDLGQHRLKGLNQLERIYQVCADGLPVHFPPPRTLTQRPMTLPIPPTPLLGRETELTEIHALLGRNEVRLVTLTGTGGTGKTRLAIEVASQSVARFADGVTFVQIAPVREPTGVVPAIAQALELSASEDLAGLRAQLRERNILLVLDNCEQVIQAVGDAAALLSSCPNLRILATSREPLHVAAEREYRVNPLRLPPASANATEIARSPAVRLFAERASALRPGFSVGEENAVAVATICARMDGLPLAIELVAARSRVLTPAKLLGMLDDPLAIASHGRRDLPERQQSLRSTIGWSYDLLPPDEQAVFRHLAVFAGGFTMEAAEAVVPDIYRGPALLDHLEALTAKSLIRLDDAGEEPRFGMLETLREFGLSRMEAAGEASGARTRHLRWYRDYCTRAFRTVSQVEQVVAISAEATNIRAALGWAATSAPDAYLGLSLAAAAGTYWWQRSAAEGARWLELMLRIATDARPSVRVTALYWFAYLHKEAGDAAEAVGIATRCVDEALSTGDNSLCILARTILGEALSQCGDPRRGLEVCRETVSMARMYGDPGVVARALWPLGLAAFECGQTDEARLAWEESCGIFNDLGDDFLLATPLAGLADIALRERDAHAAEDLVAQCLQMLRRTGDLPRMADALASLARVRLLQSRPDEAVSCLGEALVGLRGSFASGAEGANPALALASLAELCAYRHQWADTVSLAASAVAVANGPRRRPVERKEVREALIRAQEVLGRHEYQQAEDRGRRLTGPTAVRFALEVLQHAQ